MKFAKRFTIVVLLVVVLASLTACGSKGTVQFEYWNDCEALTGLKTYVAAVTDKNSEDYIPEEDRIAVFDMDGTLCGELFPEYLEYLLLEYRALEDPDYKDRASEFVKTVANEIRASGANYKTPNPPEGSTEGYDLRHGRAQAEAFAGMTPDEFIAYVKAFLQRDAQGFTGLKYADSIYKPMIEVVAYLQENGFQTYVVSGSDRMICRAVACDALNIPENQIIGMDVPLVATNEPEYEDNDDYVMDKQLHYQYNDNGKDTLVRGDTLWLKNLKMNKVFQIAQEIGKQPVLSFGNSSGDISMHEYTITDNPYKSMAFMLIADDAERDHADLEETAKRKANWEKRGYTIVSMKNDFKTIYGEGVEMVK